MGASIPLRERNTPMSWSLYNLENVSAPEARDRLESHTNLPETIRDYILAGIGGLEQIHGADVLVTITGQGHLCDKPGSYDVTSATLEVKKAEVEKAPEAA